MPTQATRSFVLPPIVAVHAAAGNAGGNRPERDRRAGARVDELSSDAPEVIDVPGVGDGPGQPGGDVRGEVDDLAPFPEHARAVAPRAGDADHLPPDVDPQRLTVVVAVEERKRLDSVA